MIADLAIFVSRYNISKDVVMVLPATFERCAEKVGMAPRQLIVSATYNRELGDYIASVAKTVAEGVA